MEAMSFIRLGRLDDAESLLSDVLVAAPRQPDALHLMGMCRHERNDPTSAERLIRRAIDCWPDGDPQVCVAWNNLGNVLVESGKPDAAVDAYRAALTALPEASGTWNNLSGLLRRLGRLEEAEAAAQQAVDAAPGDPHAWFTLARVQIELGKVHDGLQAHARGVALAPRDVVGREEVLRSLAVLGHREEAAVLWSEWLDERPEDPIALHHQAACVGRPPSRATDAYIQALFDDFASSFDAKLAKLQYRAPALIVDALIEQLGTDTEWGTVADLGCGTGLAGQLLRERASRLVGADLSQGMLDLARRRAVYDELAHTDLVTFLRGEVGSFDVAVAADVLCYFGVLDEVITAASEALRPGGTIAFTVESIPDGSDDWSLALTGRYAHSPRYIATAMAGFEHVAIEPCDLRLEAGLPVDGLLVVGRRAESARTG
jgi:predicted TPR repeat methyltransferase